MNNLESYSKKDTVDYYTGLSKSGCFAYEKFIINKYFPKKSRVLDIGCGTGRTTIALKKSGYDVVGIDYSCMMIESAKEIDSQIEYYVQDIRNLTFADGSFDCAFFSFNGLMLLETYNNRIQAMMEIKRVLKPGGVFFFTTPFLDNKVKKEYWSEKIRKYDKPLEQFSRIDRMELGDEITEEGNVKFQLHIPFVREIREMIQKCGYGILLEGRRLDYFTEEKLEDELDDNYLWVVINRNV